MQMQLVNRMATHDNLGSGRLWADDVI
jgi:hypothetical protein